MLSAEDISIILKKFNFYDQKVSIIGCPDHFIKNLSEDISQNNKKIKAYICHIKFHWFVIFYFRFDSYKIIITWDSFGSPMPKSYKKKITEYDSLIKFYYCSESLQTDSFSCGLFCITFIIFIFKLYKYNIDTKASNISIQGFINIFLNNIKNIKKNDILKTLNEIRLKLKNM